MASDAMERDRSLDYLKLIAITAVVFSHACVSTEFTELKTVLRFGNHTFAALSCFFSFRSGFCANRGWSLSWIVRRVSSFYSLFIVWNLLALTARSLSPGARGFYAVFSWSGLFLSGFTHALWFLPFIAVASVVSYLAGAVSAKHESSVWLRAMYVLWGLCALVLATSESYYAWSHPVYLFSIGKKNVPTCMFAVVFAWICLGSITSLGRNRIGMGGAGLACFAVGVVGVLMSGWAVFIWEVLMAIGAVTVFLSVRMPEQVPALPPLLSVWLFAAHGIVLHAIRFFSLPMRGMGLVRAEWVFDLAIFGITMLSLVVGFFCIIQRSWLLRNALFPNVLISERGRNDRAGLSMKS